MSAISILEMLEQLPAKEKEYVLNYTKYLYDQAVRKQRYSDELNEEELNELKERREAYLKNPESGISLEDAKKRLLGKYGL